jgi:hypothetical protein
MSSTSIDSPKTSPAVKRWERLVHLELADRAQSVGIVMSERDGCVAGRKDKGRGAEGAQRTAMAGGKCADCGVRHREIFGMRKVGERTYEDEVMEVVMRWERFVRVICEP